MTSIQIFNVCTHCRDGGPMTAGIPTQCTITAHPVNPNRFATGGGDANIFIWQFSSDYECGLEQLAKLTYHTKPVNAVSWDSTGKLLASAGDDEIISIWKKDEKYDYNECVGPSFGETMRFKEKWQPQQKLRGALAEISDICWINENKNIIVSSLDGCIGLYDVEKQSLISNVKMSSQFVQGIAIDFKHNLLAAQSTSATAKIFRISQKKKIIQNKKNKNHNNHNAKKMKISYHLTSHVSIAYYPRTKEEREQQKKYDEEYKALLLQKSTESKTMKIDETENTNKSKSKAKPKKKRVSRHSLFKANLITTSKKPCWSPDGLLLCMVAGQSMDKTKDAIHFFHRSNLTQKVTTILLPESTHATVIRFNPLKLRLNDDDNDVDKGSIVDKYGMKYKMLFSIICGAELFVFDTSKINAIFYWKDEDTQNFFDMKWSADGKSLIISDIEGFLTRLSFHDNDFVAI